MSRQSLAVLFLHSEGLVMAYCVEKLCSFVNLLNFGNLSECNSLFILQHVSAETSENRGKKVFQQNRLPTALLIDAGLRSWAIIQTSEVSGPKWFTTREKNNSEAQNLIMSSGIILVRLPTVSVTLMGYDPSIRENATAMSSSVRLWSGPAKKAWPMCASARNSVSARGFHWLLYWEITVGR